MAPNGTMPILGITPPQWGTILPHRDLFPPQWVQILWHRDCSPPQLVQWLSHREITPPQWGPMPLHRKDTPPQWGLLLLHREFTPPHWEPIQAHQDLTPLQWGANTSAPSGFETAIGRYNTNYTPASTITWNSADRLFVIGNGTGSGAESNALIIYKNGTMNINDAYDMPTADGTAGQVMTTDGAGVVSFQSPSDNQDLSLSGNTLSLTNDATTVDLSGYMDNTDDWTNSGNNIYYDNGSVGIGTSSPNSKLHVNSPSTATGAHFRVQDAGSTKFCVANNGYTALYYNDAPSYNLELNANSAAKPTSSVMDSILRCPFENKCCSI